MGNAHVEHRIGRHDVGKELGVAVAASKTVKVVENADRHLHLVLPPKPAGRLSADEADRLSADRAG